LLEGADVAVLGEEHERGIWVGRIGHGRQFSLTPAGGQGCEGNAGEMLNAKG
jgi:hypothetical protein